MDPAFEPPLSLSLTITLLTSPAGSRMAKTVSSFASPSFAASAEAAAAQSAKAARRQAALAFIGMSFIIPFLSRTGYAERFPSF